MEVHNMDYAALKDHIISDPTLAEYSKSGNDGAIVDALNAKTIKVNSFVKRSDFAVWAAATGMRSVIQDLSSNTSSPLRASALSLIDLLSGSTEGIDFSKSENIALLQIWVDDGALSLKDKDSLLALSEEKISLAQQKFGADVTITNIANALRP
jgi:hypothetical protein